jgi:hypothetical protein
MCLFESHAVEEYGKAILLRNQIDGKKISYKIPKWIFESHNAKLIEGFENLPSQCRVISRGVKISTNASTKSRTIEINSSRKLSIPPGLTGTFTSIGSNSNYKQDIELKTACFYIDWDHRNRTWKYDIATDTSQLRDYIEYFKDALNTFRCFSKT